MRMDSLAEIRRRPSGENATSGMAMRCPLQHGDLPARGEVDPFEHPVLGADGQRPAIRSRNVQGPDVAGLGRQDFRLAAIEVPQMHRAVQAANAERVGLG